MSTSPDASLVTLLSRWLAGHVSDEDLRREVEGADLAPLGEGRAAAVEELRAELSRGGGRGDLERTVRETLEALALG